MPSDAVLTTTPLAIGFERRKPILRTPSLRVSSAPPARVAHLAQAQQTLGTGTVIDSLRSATGLGQQEARDHLARFLFRGDEILRDVAVLSGGERTRLALPTLAARAANLLVLDEPTNQLY